MAVAADEPAGAQPSDPGAAHPRGVGDGRRATEGDGTGGEVAERAPADREAAEVEPAEVEPAEVEPPEVEPAGAAAAEGGEPVEGGAVGDPTADGPALIRSYVARHQWEPDDGQLTPPPRRPAVVAGETGESAGPDDSPEAAAPEGEPGGPVQPPVPGRGRRQRAVVAVVAAGLISVTAAVVSVGGWSFGGSAAPPTSTAVVTGPGYAVGSATGGSSTRATRSPTPSPSARSTTKPPAPTSPPATTGPAPTTLPPTTPPPAPTTPPPPSVAVTGAIVSTLTAPKPRCVDVKSADPTPGTPVQAYDCNGTPAQMITLTTDGRLRVLARCIQPAGGATAAGTGMVIGDCVASDQPLFAAQQWRVDGSLIRHPASGLCLAIPGASLDNWVQLRLEACTGGPGQRWTTPA